MVDLQGLTERKDKEYWLNIAWTSIELAWRMHAGGTEVHMRAGWVWFDSGMDPLIVIVYDRMGAKMHGEVGEQHERRIFTCQGMRHLGDSILDHMNGY